MSDQNSNSMVSPSTSISEARKQDRNVRADTSFFGHPRGLAALFNLELWERFSYLGFQAILALYFADAIASGGLGYDQQTASSVVAAYGALVYLLALVGAWIADRVVGTYRSVLWGSVLIASGHIFMGIPREFATWVGLALIILGTGLLKPNVSTMVGELYEQGDRRRDAGFSIYYSGINIGAFLGPLVAGFLGQTYHWHLGFAAAAVGMIIGIFFFIRGRSSFAGKERSQRIQNSFEFDANFWKTTAAATTAIVIGLVFFLRHRCHFGNAGEPGDRSFCVSSFCFYYLDGTFGFCYPYGKTQSFAFFLVAYRPCGIQPHVLPDREHFEFPGPGTNLKHDRKFFLPIHLVHIFNCDRRDHNGTCSCLDLGKTWQTAASCGFESRHGYDAGWCRISNGHTRSNLNPAWRPYVEHLDGLLLCFPRAWRFDLADLRDVRNHEARTARICLSNYGTLVCRNGASAGYPGTNR